jgi:hypothetical protein
LNDRLQDFSDMELHFSGSARPLLPKPAKNDNPPPPIPDKPDPMRISSLLNPPTRDSWTPSSSATHPSSIPAATNDAPQQPTENPFAQAGIALRKRPAQEPPEAQHSRPGKKRHAKQITAKARQELIPHIEPLRDQVMFYSDIVEELNKNKKVRAIAGRDLTEQDIRNFVRYKDLPRQKKQSIPRDVYKKLVPILDEVNHQKPGLSQRKMADELNKTQEVKTLFEANGLGQTETQEKRKLAQMDISNLLKRRRREAPGGDEGREGDGEDQG